jgi:hypothetical protein
MKPVERLAAAEASLAQLVKDRDNLKQALGDPALVTWVYERGPIPRRLTSFEIATVKRLALMEEKIIALEDECEEILSDTICGLSGIDGEPDDPEVLLRASLVVLSRQTKAGTALPETRAVMRGLLRYLKSLADD